MTSTSSAADGSNAPAEGTVWDRFREQLRRSHEKWDRLSLWNTAETLRAAWRPQTGPEDDVGDVYLGDVTTHQLTASPPRGLGPIARVAAAGLIAAGLGLPIGLGLAAPTLLEMLRQPPPAVEPPAAAAPQEDWWFDLYVGPPHSTPPHSTKPP